jgi:two-component system, NarL family, response regulator NreC
MVESLPAARSAADAPPAEITLVVADDHAAVRRGVRARLEEHGDLKVVAEATTAAEALEAIRRQRPAVVVLDLHMPGEPTLPFVADMLAASPGTRILILTMQDDPAYAREALRAGVRGYLLKEAVDEELVDAVRAVAAGETYLQLELRVRLAGVLAG